MEPPNDFKTVTYRSIFFAEVSPWFAFGGPMYYHDNQTDTIRSNSQS